MSEIPHPSVPVPVRAALVAALPMTVGAWGCDAPPEGTTWQGTRDTVGPVEVVRNPAAPLLEASAVAVHELWRTSGEASGELWERPSVVEIGDGRVYVLDAQAHRVHVLDAGTGEPLFAFGAEGDGPGEFRRPFGIEAVGDVIAVGDGAGPGVELFSPDGEYRRSLRLEFLPFLLEGLPDGRLWVTGLGAGTAITRTLRLDGETAPWGAPDTSLIDPGLVFDDCPRWGGDREGLVRGHCRRLAFQRLGAGGEPLGEVHTDRPPAMASPAELDTIERRMRRMVGRARMPPAEAERFVEERLEESRVKAVYVKARSDLETGLTFIQEQPPPILGGGTATLHAFTPDGRYLASLPFDRAWPDFAVRDGRVYALAEDPYTGLVELVAIRLELPPES